MEFWVWRATGGGRAYWFGRETWPLLSQFCRHVVIARRVAKLIDGTNDTISLGSTCSSRCGSASQRPLPRSRRGCACARNRRATPRRLDALRMCVRGNAMPKPQSFSSLAAMAALREREKERREALRRGSSRPTCASLPPEQVRRAEARRVSGWPHRITTPETTRHRQWKERSGAGFPLASQP
jgi:hypothetical protein